MKSVFITGAAAGIGLATAKLFASHGYFVGFYDINEAGLSEAVTSGDFPSACSGYCDVTSRDSIAAAMADFASHTDGQMTVLVNNAGVLTAGAFEEISPQAHDLMININIKGLTDVAQLGFAYLKATPGSCLVNLCSSSSIHGVPRLAVYSASKFYVNALTQALHIEWEPHDIRVTCVKPGIVNTQMGQDVVTSAATRTDITLTPEEIAGAIYRAVGGIRVSYVVGRLVRFWALIDKFLPESLRVKMTRRLVSSK